MVSRKNALFSLLFGFPLILVGCNDQEASSNSEGFSLDGANKNCEEENRTYILGTYAPDGLEMWDSNPNNDPEWDEPEIIFTSHSEEVDNTLTITLTAWVYGDVWECSCSYTKNKGLFGDKFKRISTHAQITNPSNRN